MQHTPFRKPARSRAAERPLHFEQDPPHKHPTPLSYTIDGAMRATGLGRSKIYSLIGDGTLTRIKVGTRTLIPAASLRALIGEAA